jgi:hypothetical protein
MREQLGGAAQLYVRPKRGGFVPIFLSPLALMEIQAATLFTHAPDGRIVFQNEPWHAERPAPRLFLGSTAEGVVCRFRRDLPSELVRQIRAVVASLSRQVVTQPQCLDRFKAVLQEDSPVKRMSIGPAYRFPDELDRDPGAVQIGPQDTTLLTGKLSEWIEQLPYIAPCMVVIKDGQAVSLCATVRVSPQACEAGVDTLESFRRRGYAKAVVGAWGAAVRVQGRIPLYSTSLENVASQGVARSLGLIQYGVDLSFY